VGITQLPASPSLRGGEENIRNGHEDTTDKIDSLCAGEEIAAVWIARRVGYTPGCMTDFDERYRAHEDAQRRAWAALSPIDRLRWLQQAKEFCRRFLGAARRTPQPPRQK